MATSNTFTYSVTAADVIAEALENIGVLATGGTAKSADSTSCLRTLNMMVKQWSGNFDYAPGLKMFARKTGYVFMQKDTGSYTLGPSGDNATLSYVSTTMRVAGAALDTTLEITSSTGMTAADKIGIELDSGTIQWTTVSSVTDSDTVVIDVALTGAAAAGNSVFTYTTILVRPLYIENAALRDMSGNDTPMREMSKGHYEGLPSKYADGIPAEYMYENLLLNGKLYLDVEPSDVSYVMRMTFMTPAEDYTAATDDIAFPQEWYMALSLGLAKLISPKFGYKWADLNESNFTSALAMAKSAYAETTEVYFQPGLEE